MRKEKVLTRCFNRDSTRIVAIEVKEKSLDRDKSFRLAKLERDAEKIDETRKHRESLELQSRRDKLCRKLLSKIETRIDKKMSELDNPTLDMSDIGLAGSKKEWILSIDSNGNRTLERKSEMKIKFDADELVEAGNDAIEKILELNDSDGLTLAKLHQTMKTEIADLLDEEIEKKIALCELFDKFFIAQKIALDGLQRERNELKKANREFDLTRSVRNEPAKKNEVIETAAKLDKKNVRKVLSKDREKFSDLGKAKLKTFASMMSDISMMDDFDVPEQEGK